MLRLRPLALLAVLSLAAACGGGDDDGGGNGDGGPDDGDGGGGGGADAAQADCEPVSGTDLGLQLITDEVEEPVLVTAAPGDPRLFILEKHGRIRIVKDGALLAMPFLDIDGRVGSAEAPNERGLLGLAFHPDYASNGRFFVYFTETDTGDDLVREFHVSGGDPDIADAASEIEILSVDDPYPNHNGGMMAFGDDGYLYIGIGDGGDGGDPEDRAQNDQSLLGKMLRIDVDNGSPYAIPDDNPFAGDGGGVKEEIFMMGLRNPWRWSFDRQTGDMYIGDVGQGTWEEVDVVPVADQNGANLGWDEVEGTECFDDQQPVADPDCTLANYFPPVTVYENPPGDDARSITGGYIYRGGCYPDLAGTYFYGDYVTSQIWTFKYAGGEATEKTDVSDILNPDLDPEEDGRQGLVQGLSSFGQDAYGEIYVVSLRPGSFGIADGAIYKIVVE